MTITALIVTCAAMAAVSLGVVAVESEPSVIAAAITGGCVLIAGAISTWVQIAVIKRTAAQAAVERAEVATAVVAVKEKAEETSAELATGVEKIHVLVNSRSDRQEKRIAALEKYIAKLTGQPLDEAKAEGSAIDAERPNRINPKE